MVSPRPVPPSRPDTSGKKILSRMCLGHARPVVHDLDHHAQPVQLAGERDLARDARAQHDLAAALQRLRRVARDVEQGLDDLLRSAATGGRLTS